MTNDNQFTITPFSNTPEDALAANKKGMLTEWVEDYLLSEGNHDLFKVLRQENATTIELANFPLSLLKRIEGPEPKMEERETLVTWEEKVSNISQIIKMGHMPPPLLVTDFWRPWEIADGNHRHEALMRMGYKKYWTIIFMKYEETKELFNKYIS